MFTQLITPDPAGPVAEEGMCLQYVRQAFGLPARYGSATEAWANSGSKHPGRDYPQEVWFPVWWELAGNPYGHVAMAHSRYGVWSTSNLAPNPLKHHPDIADVERYYAKYGHPLTYLGWTEDVAGYPVIAPGLSAAGTTTITEEEDEMGQLFENETVWRDKTVKAVFDARFDTRDERNNITGTISLRDMLTYYAANIAMDRRALRDGLTAAVTTITAAVKAGQAVDPQVIADQIVAGLGKITLEVVQKP